MFRVLLTNDDGIIAPGIRALARQLARWCSVTVVAPNRPRSATSHSITLHKPLRLAPANRDCEEYAGENIAAFSCSGTPSDCVMLGVLHVHANEALNLVVSGINDGMNVAEDLTYSGTVGGALEGAILGVPSIAASLAGHRRLRFSQAAEVLDAIISLLVHGSVPERLASWHADLGLPAATAGDRTESNGSGKPAGWIPAGLAGQLCLNVNIPDVSPGQIKGLKWTRAGSRIYEDVVRVSRDPNGREYYWLGGTKVLDHKLADSDTQAISEGWVSITPVTYDITQHSDLKRLESWYTERYSGPGGQNRHG